MKVPGARMQWNTHHRNFGRDKSVGAANSGPSSFRGASKLSQVAAVCRSVDAEAAADGAALAASVSGLNGLAVPKRWRVFCRADTSGLISAACAVTVVLAAPRGPVSGSGRAGARGGGGDDVGGHEGKGRGRGAADVL